MAVRQLSCHAHKSVDRRFSGMTVHCLHCPVRPGWHDNLPCDSHLYQGTERVVVMGMSDKGTIIRRTSSPMNPCSRFAQPVGFLASSASSISASFIQSPALFDTVASASSRRRVDSMKSNRGRAEHVISQLLPNLLEAELRSNTGAYCSPTLQHVTHVLGADSKSRTGLRFRS